MERSAGADLQRWRLLLAYDGAAFRGFALQPEVPTVAGALRQALERTARMSEPPVITCAGRTDAGVHARGQVVHVDLPPIAYDGAGLARAINRQLAPKVVVVRAEKAGAEFDARRSATGRAYRYLVWNAPGTRPVALRHRLAREGPTRPGLHAHGVRCPARHPRFPLLLPSSGRAPTPRSLSCAGSPGPSGAWTTRPRCGDARDGGADGRLLRFDIAAASFCHQMVRSLVGALVEVGRGRLNAAGLMERLRAASRHQMPDPAPALGLCLVSVSYDVTSSDNPRPD